jgi:hypothetical protein
MRSVAFAIWSSAHDREKEKQRKTRDGEEFRF